MSRRDDYIEVEVSLSDARVKEKAERLGLEADAPIEWGRFTICLPRVECYWGGEAIDGTPVTCLSTGDGSHSAIRMSYDDFDKIHRAWRELG